MKRLTLLSLALLATFCTSRGPTAPGQSAVPGHGAIRIDIVPNPIQATHISGNSYEFPFEVVVRETGGRDVTIDRVTADVYALSTIKLGSETYDAARIQSMGYSTVLRANSEARYRFNPRREVTDERVFGQLSADVRVVAHDDTGTETTANTTVTVRR